MDLEKIEYYYNKYKNIFFDAKLNSIEIMELIKKDDYDFYLKYLQVKFFKYKNIKLLIKNNNLYINPIDKFNFENYIELFDLVCNLTRDLILYKENLIMENDDFLYN